MQRRIFLQLSTMFLGSSIAFPLRSAILDRKTLSVNTFQEPSADTLEKYQQLIAIATKDKWHESTTSECMVKVGMFFLNTPYVGGTLEGIGDEVCRVSLTGLDCVTFFESVLNIAWCIRAGKTQFSDVQKAIQFTRYRNATVKGYLSRLHYTSEWFSHNSDRVVVRDISRQLGGTLLKTKLNFMSEHPQYYPYLKANEKAISEIRRIEKKIEKRKRYYIPKKSIEKIESKLMSGDIVAISTNVEGLDYAHTGLIYIDNEKNARFLHASSKQQKVVLDTTISNYLQSVSSHTGISVVRPY